MAATILDALAYDKHIGSHSSVGVDLLTSQLVIISYNLHGFNQGKHGIDELISTIEPDFFLLQEHWLTPDNMYKLSELSAKYSIFGSSAMGACVSSGPLIGRPFGGTAIMVNNKHVSGTTNLISSDRYTAIKVGDLLLITVYMPCVGTAQRDSLYNDILCELDALLYAHRECKQCFIGGDFNTDLDSSVCVSEYVNKFICSNTLHRLDMLIPVSNKLTYINEANQCGSTIDYMLISDPNGVKGFNVLDLDINLSDHRPVIAIVTQCWAETTTNIGNQQPSQPLVEHFRWDHAPLGEYYEHTRVLLQPILLDLQNLVANADCFENDFVLDCIDRLYNDVINALNSSANLFIPKHGKNFYKFWWTQELDVTKSNAVAACRVWKNSGCPRNGVIFAEYKKCKLLYKKRVRDEQTEEKCVFTNDLHDALLAKSGQAFWRTWKAKFPNNSSNLVLVDGAADSHIIVDKFAKFFESNSKPLSAARNDELRAKYSAMRSNYCGSPLLPNQQFDVELLSKLISNMKNGKAAGLDGISCEHIKFSHPILVSILSKLFNLFLSFSHIPHSFGASYTIPIPKCVGRTRALSVDDFRGISISPTISKLFEMAIIDRFASYFETSDHQFGFKKNQGCREAIFCVRNVVETFITNGSTVSVCALDLSKAFDRMNHYALLCKLMQRNYPVQLLTILETWFTVTVTCVKWKERFSRFFSLNVGVRQGGVLSPLFFAMFIDGLVTRVKSVNVGCYLSFSCCCVLLYADDIILLSPSITGLQLLVNACELECDSLDMQINVNKSCCVRFGSRYNEPCSEIVSKHGGVIHWADSCRYLGVNFVCGRFFRCSLDDSKSRFFRAFNGVYGKVGHFASDQVLLSLLRAKCIPILLYGIESCPLLVRQINSLEFSLTRTLMRIFKTNSPVVVKQCQVNFGIMPVASQLIIRTARFLTKYIASQNVLCSLFTQNATSQLRDIFSQFGKNVRSVAKLNEVIFDTFCSSL